MLVLITYDVNTATDAGKKRLRKIAKECVNYGQRVQNSVFECFLDAAQCKMLQAKLCAMIDYEKDSLQFYYLGNNYQKKLSILGIKHPICRRDHLFYNGANGKLSWNCSEIRTRKVAFFDLRK